MVLAQLPPALETLAVVAVGVIIFLLGGVAGVRTGVKRVLTGTFVAALDERYLPRSEYAREVAAMEQLHQQEHRRMWDSIEAATRLNTAVNELSQNVAALDATVRGQKEALAIDLAELRKDVRALRDTRL